MELDFSQVYSLLVAFRGTAAENSFRCSFIHSFIHRVTCLLGTCPVTDTGLSMEASEIHK